MNKRLNAIIASGAGLLAIPGAAFAQLPKPTYGWNLGNSMEPPSGIGSWGGPPTRALIDSVAKAGFNTVRIPCAWDCHADQTTHKIDPVYMARVKEAVDWCYANRLYVVVNDHWDSGWLENHLTGTVNPALDAKMKSYWSQIATTFAGYDNHLLFAAANEPNVKTAEQMAELTSYYQTFVDAVRATGGNNTSRWLVLQGASADIDATDKLMNTFPKDPTPGRLMAEIHFYSPYQFCLMDKDQSWGKMFYYWGQGYHSSSDPTRNPTWGEESSVDTEFDKMRAKFVSKGIPVIVGEFRAERRGGLPAADAALNYASCTYWNKYVVDSANSHGLSPICWDTPGSMFDFKTGALQEPEAVRSLTGGPALPPPGGDGAQQCFELSSQGWTSGGAPITEIAMSSDQKFAGAHSLSVNFSGAAGTATAAVSAPPVPAGRPVTFHVWIPGGSKITAIQPFVQDSKGVRTGKRQPVGNLKTNAWNTITMTVPPKAVTPLQQLGVEFTTGAAWTGSCYIDSVSW